ncbi:CHAT domain-containing protein, partial [Angustibacter peucedani]
PPAAVDELRAALGSAALVEYLAVDGELLALTLAGDDAPGPRGPRLHRLGPLDGVQDPLLHLQFALGRLATGRGSGAALAAALAGACQAADELDARLLAPLGDLGGGALVVAPTEALHAVPWSMLGTAARGPLHLVRSGTAWLGAVEHRRRARESRERAADVFVTGPDVSLAPVRAADGPDAERAGVVTVDGPAATVARTMALLDGAGVAHVAAHGTFRSDNPMLSSLRLADGLLTVYDLEALERTPRLVVLAACHSAAAQVLPGNQLLGVAHALLTLGAAGVVATTLPTPDAETAVLMDALHDELDRGLDAGEALHRARARLDLGTPAGIATSAGFDLYGC